MEFWSWLSLFIFCALFECVSGRDCLFGVPPITRIILLRLLFSSQISTWGDSGPNGSIIDPFLSSVCGCATVCGCVCVLVCVCVSVFVPHLHRQGFRQWPGGIWCLHGHGRSWECRVARMPCFRRTWQIVARSALAFDALIIPWCLIAVREGFDAVPHNHVPPKQMLKLLLLPFDYLRIVGGAPWNSTSLLALVGRTFQAHAACYN